MSRNEDRKIDFISRWSRRKLGKEAEPKPNSSMSPVPPEHVTESRTTARHLNSRELRANLERLDFGSDYSRFMAPDTPEQLRVQALRKLWTANSAHFSPDDLDDYLEDFSEAAMAVPAVLLRSAYAVGRGMAVPGECDMNVGESTPPHGGEPSREAGTQQATAVTAERQSTVSAGDEMRTPPNRPANPSSE
jgi:hypothetical protein